MTDLLKTPLHDIHKRLGAKMVPYAGWEMPVQYPTGIMAEHQAVRSKVGIFDVSHMGEIEVTGPDRNAFVNRITCNDVSVLEPGQVQYSGILTKEGTFVDDCTVYRFDDKLMIVVNAANTAAAWEHIVDQKGGANIRLKDISNDVGLIAVQGPEAEATLQSEFDLTVSVPPSLPQEQLELHAVRRCLYGDGRAAHLMYRLNGEPLSLFVVPGLARPDAELSLFGHEQIVWMQGDRTYMLVTSAGSRDALARVASHLRNEAE